MKYSDVLELIILFLLIIFFYNFVTSHYNCEISKELSLLKIYNVNVSSYFNESFNYSIYERKYYSMSDIKYNYIRENGYSYNFVCNFRFKK